MLTFNAVFPSQPLTSTRSGPASQSSAATRIVQGHHAEGGVHHQPTMPDAIACQGACAEDSRCNSWDYHVLTQICYLKEIELEVGTANPDVMAGT